VDETSVETAGRGRLAETKLLDKTRQSPSAHLAGTPSGNALGPAPRLGQGWTAWNRFTCRLERFFSPPPIFWFFYKIGCAIALLVLLIFGFDLLRALYLLIETNKKVETLPGSVLLVPLCVLAPFLVYFLLMLPLLFLQSTIGAVVHYVSTRTAHSRWRRSIQRGALRDSTPPECVKTDESLE
jgi:hypothetical protein